MVNHIWQHLLKQYFVQQENPSWISMQIVVLKSPAFYKAQMLIESCNEEYQIFYEILLQLVVLFMLETMLPKNGEMTPKVGFGHFLQGSYFRSSNGLILFESSSLIYLLQTSRCSSSTCAFIEVTSFFLSYVMKSL